MAVVNVAEGARLSIVTPASEDERTLPSLSFPVAAIITSPDEIIWAIGVDCGTGTNCDEGKVTVARLDEGGWKLIMTSLVETSPRSFAATGVDATEGQARFIIPDGILGVSAAGEVSGPEPIGAIDLAVCRGAAGAVIITGDLSAIHEGANDGNLELPAAREIELLGTDGEGRVASGPNSDDLVNPACTGDGDPVLFGESMVWLFNRSSGWDELNLPPEYKRPLDVHVPFNAGVGLLVGGTLVAVSNGRVIVRDVVGSADLDPDTTIRLIGTQTRLYIFTTDATGQAQFRRMLDAN